MRPRALLLLTVGLLACGRDSITTPRDDSGDVGEQHRAVVILLPPGRAETLLAGDTVTLTAAVLDGKARELTTGTIEWLSPMIVSVGPRNGLLKVPSTTTEVVAVLKRPGFADVHGRATISAKRFPGAVYVWTPGVSLLQVPSPEGARGVNAVAINDRGEVVGTVDYGDRSQGFIWSQQLGFRELSTPLPHRSTFAVAISEKGTVVGSIGAAPGQFTAFLWSIEKGMTEIGGGPIPTSVTFSGINAAGRVAGSRDGTAFMWSESSGFQDVGPIVSPDGVLQPVDINDNDDLLLDSNGKYSPNVDYGFAFLPYGVLLTAGSRISVDCGECALSDMNNGRVIAGNILAPVRNGFRWTRERGVEPLPLGPGSSSEVFAINDAGVVAGSILVREMFWRTGATIWRGEEPVVIPNQWGARATVARDINNLGQVLVVVR